jgi:hypothetical protein
VVSFIPTWADKSAQGPVASHVKPLKSFIPVPGPLGATQKSLNDPQSPFSSLFGNHYKHPHDYMTNHERDLFPGDPQRNVQFRVDALVWR